MSLTSRQIESVPALADLLSKKLQFAFFTDGGINCHLLLGKFGTGNLDTVLEPLNFVQKTSVFTFDGIKLGFLLREFGVRRQELDFLRGRDLSRSFSL